MRRRLHILLLLAILGCGQAERERPTLGPQELARLRAADKAYASLMTAAMAARSGPKRIAVLRNGIGSLAGTRYEKPVEAMIVKIEQSHQRGEEFKAIFRDGSLEAMAVKVEQSHRRGEEFKAILRDGSLSRLEKLRLSKQLFEGTHMERIVEELLEKEERREGAGEASGVPKH